MVKGPAGNAHSLAAARRGADLGGRQVFLSRMGQKPTLVARRTLHLGNKSTKPLLRPRTREVVLLPGRAAAAARRQRATRAAPGPGWRPRSQGGGAAGPAGWGGYSEAQAVEPRQVTSVRRAGAEARVEPRRVGTVPTLGATVGGDGWSSDTSDRRQRWQTGALHGERSGGHAGASWETLEGRAVAVGGASAASIRSSLVPVPMQRVVVDRHDPRDSNRMTYATWVQERGGAGPGSSTGSEALAATRRVIAFRGEATVGPAAELRRAALRAEATAEVAPHRGGASAARRVALAPSETERHSPGIQRPRYITAMRALADDEPTDDGCHRRQLAEASSSHPRRTMLLSSRGVGTRLAAAREVHQALPSQTQRTGLATRGVVGRLPARRSASGPPQRRLHDSGSDVAGRRAKRVKAKSESPFDSEAFAPPPRVRAGGAGRGDAPPSARALSAPALGGQDLEASTRESSRRERLGSSGPPATVTGAAPSEDADQDDVWQGAPHKRQRRSMATPPPASVKGARWGETLRGAAAAVASSLHAGSGEASACGAAATALDAGSVEARGSRAAVGRRRGRQGLPAEEQREEQVRGSRRVAVDHVRSRQLLPPEEDEEDEEEMEDEEEEDGEEEVAEADEEDEDLEYKGKGEEPAQADEVEDEEEDDDDYEAPTCPAERRRQDPPRRIVLEGQHVRRRCGEVAEEEEAQEEQRACGEAVARRNAATAAPPPPLVHRRSASPPKRNRRQRGRATDPTSAPAEHEEKPRARRRGGAAASAGAGGGGRAAERSEAEGSRSAAGRQRSELPISAPPIAGPPDLPASPPQSRGTSGRSRRVAHEEGDGARERSRSRVRRRASAAAAAATGSSWAPAGSTSGGGASRRAAASGSAPPRQVASRRQDADALPLLRRRD